MLKFIMRIFYHDKIYTTESELFYKLYKWDVGLFTLLSLRRYLSVVILGIIGIICFIFINTSIYLHCFIVTSMTLVLCIEVSEKIKSIKFNLYGARTPAQIRTIKMEEFIRKIVSKNGKALGRKEWKAIKRHDIGLYHDLLCDECDHCCYFYSLEIAKIIKDSTLIWGGVEEPFEEGHKYYAHAVILRNGYIYDSNMRQSEKYEDFTKLYKFKLYKKWQYDEYSRKDFRESERADFRKWCIEYNVSEYEMF